MKKIIKNTSGNILIRTTEENITGSASIVEILHLWHDNQSGCVIATYRVRIVDGHGQAELIEVHDRLTSTVYDSPDILLEALRYGRKLADIAVESLDYSEEDKEI